MPLGTKLLIFAVVILLLFAGLSVGTYLSLFRASIVAEQAQEQLAKLSLVETLAANCASLTETPDHLTRERSHRALRALRRRDWDPEGWKLLARVLALAEPLTSGEPLTRHEELEQAVCELKDWILGRVREGLRSAADPVYDRAVRLLVASCLLTVGGSATFAWLANRMARERKALEARVHRSEKLAALGTLAAGIAHEINNPLATISMSAEAVGEHLPADSEEGKYCLAIQEEALRCQSIIGDLSDLARGGSVDREPVDPEELLRESLAIIGRSAPLPAGRLEEEIPDDLPLISADRGKLLQVLVNLLRNGLEASGAHGTVRLTARRLEDRLSMEVSDDGKGIPFRLLERIFEPFYTDKAHGVGLGLTLCHRIAELHGGELLVSSPGPGQGSTFTLLLPLEARDGA